MRAEQLITTWIARIAVRRPVTLKVVQPRPNNKVATVHEISWEASGDALAGMAAALVDAAELHAQGIESGRAVQYEARAYLADAKASFSAQSFVCGKSAATMQIMPSRDEPEVMDLGKMTGGDAGRAQTQYSLALMKQNLEMSRLLISSIEPIGRYQAAALRRQGKRIKKLEKAADGHIQAREDALDRTQERQIVAASAATKNRILDEMWQDGRALMPTAMNMALKHFGGPLAFAVAQSPAQMALRAVARSFKGDQFEKFASILTPEQQVGFFGTVGDLLDDDKAITTPAKRLGGGDPVQLLKDTLGSLSLEQMGAIAGVMQPEQMRQFKAVRKTLGL